jgi:hypothetical protein
MKGLHGAFRDRQARVVVINRGEPRERIERINQQWAPGLTVVVDESWEIAKAFGVPAVPFLFVLDGQGRVSSRMPYTKNVAAHALNHALGAAPTRPRVVLRGAG